MDIPVKGDLDAGVSQYLAERLYLEAHLDTAGGKGMAERVEIHMLQTALLGIPRKAVLQGARLHIAWLSGQNVGLRLRPREPGAQLHRQRRQRDIPCRVFAFRRADADCRLLLGVLYLKPLHGART